MDLKPKKLAIASSSVEDLSIEDIQLNVVKFMNYNIFCNTRNTKDTAEAMRIEAIVRIIKEADPDVVALHNVDSNAFALVMGMLEHRYLIFQVFTDEKDMYGDVLLFHKERIELPDGSQPYYYDFKNGRIIGTEIRTKSAHQFHILTTSLDPGMDAENLRSDQFDTIQQVLKPLKNFILLADFPVADIHEPLERQITAVRMSDAWIKLGCPEQLRTCTGVTNRCNRIYYRLPDTFWLNSLIASGLDRMKDTGAPPSPHAAITAVFCEEIA